MMGVHEKRGAGGFPVGESDRGDVASGLELPTITAQSMFFHAPLKAADRPVSGVAGAGSRRGTTLIELIMAFALLSTAIMVVFGGVVNVRQLQISTQSQELAIITVGNILNRYSGASVFEISTWMDSGSHLAEVDSPMTDWTTLRTVQGLGLVSSELGAFVDPATQEESQNLRFTVGFYRVINNVTATGSLATGPGQEGLWGNQHATRLLTVADQLHDRSLSLADNASRRAPYRIIDPSDTTEVSVHHPVAIMVMAWMVDPRGGQPRLLHEVVGMVGTP